MTAPGIPSVDPARLDQHVRAMLARATASLSPASAALAILDWWMHLASSPGKQMDLAALAARQAGAFARYLLGTCTSDCASERCVEPPEHDRRFAAPKWKHWSFAPLHQGFLLAQQWWDAATQGIAGVSRHHEDVVNFAARQWLDVVSPGNFPFTNPLVLERTLRQGGMNLVRGAANFVDDIHRLISGNGPRGTENFGPGRDVAITPGSYVLEK